MVPILIIVDESTNQVKTTLRLICGYLMSSTVYYCVPETTVHFGPSSYLISNRPNRFFWFLPIRYPIPVQWIYEVLSPSWVDDIIILPTVNENFNFLQYNDQIFGKTFGNFVFKAVIYLIVLRNVIDTGRHSQVSFVPLDILIHRIIVLLIGFKI